MSSNPTAMKPQPPTLPAQASRKRKFSTMESTNTPIEIEEEEAFSFSVSLQDKYSGYPTGLRTRLETQFHTTMSSVLSNFIAGKTTESRYTYNLVREEITENMSSGHHNQTTRLRGGMRSLSLSNAALLEYDCALGEQGKRSTFVRLAKQDGICNPEFARRHKVRYGEVGWGFDDNGCLSMYTVRLDEGKVKEQILYVRRIEMQPVKNEQEKDQE